MSENRTEEISVTIIDEDFLYSQDLPVMVCVLTLPGPIT